MGVKRKDGWVFQVMRPDREEPYGADVVQLVSTMPNRLYAQAFIDERDWTVAAIDAFTVALVCQYWQEHQREIVRVALGAFMDGYEVGHGEGYDAGIEEGSEEERLKRKKKRDQKWAARVAAATTASKEHPR